MLIIYILFNQQSKGSCEDHVFVNKHLPMSSNTDLQLDFEKSILNMFLCKNKQTGWSKLINNYLN